MNKRIIIYLVIGAALAAGIVWAATFYSQNLRGVSTALLPAPQDISEVISNSNQTAELENITLAEAQNSTDFPLSLPDGFSISIFADNLKKPRVLMKDNEGVLLVSIPDQGKVVALPDTNNDGKADDTLTVVQGLDRPHGLAMRCLSSCILYVAEESGITTFDYDSLAMKGTNQKRIIDLPSGDGHWTRTLLFLPAPQDDTLIISVGSSCNVCEESEEFRAVLLRSDADGSAVKVFATGLRNSVFITTHPKTNEIWATENGRDKIGDDIPPDEINIVKQGLDYGWPICYGKNIHDTNFDTKTYIQNPCESSQPSFIDIQAHSAPLGLEFIPNKGWPPTYSDDLLVAYHGSWNRTIPTGYKIVRHVLDSHGNYSHTEDFISGWLTDDARSLGRPVDVLADSDGVLYISDDKAGVIYRVEVLPPA